MLTKLDLKCLTLKFFEIKRFLLLSQIKHNIYPYMINFAYIGAHYQEGIPGHLPNLLMNLTKPPASKKWVPKKDYPVDIQLACTRTGTGLSGLAHKKRTTKRCFSVVLFGEPDGTEFEPFCK